MARTLPVRKPDSAREGPAFVTHDERFTEVLGDEPRLERAVETDAHEGPVYAADEDALYFTTLPRWAGVPAAGHPAVAIKRVQLDGERFPVGPDHVSIVRPQTNVANGMTLDLEGRLLVCEQGTGFDRARISRLDRTTGEQEVVVEGWMNLPLNSPNDVVVASDGTVWFTDPSYGHLQGFRPEPLVGDYVYRHDPHTGRTSVVDDSFDKPNGLAFSPDEQVLYIGDSGANHEPGTYDSRRPHRIVAFEVGSSRQLSKARLFAVITPGVPDGIKVDCKGRVYASSSSGVQVFDPSGDLIGEIRLPGPVNFTFGGPRGNVLFVTTDTAIWAAVIHATGPAASTRALSKEEWTCRQSVHVA